MEGAAARDAPAVPARDAPMVPDVPVARGVPGLAPARDVPVPRGLPVARGATARSDDVAADADGPATGDADRLGAPEGREGDGPWGAARPAVRTSGGGVRDAWDGSGRVVTGTASVSAGPARRVNLDGWDGGHEGPIPLTPARRPHLASRQTCGLAGWPPGSRTWPVRGAPPGEEHAPGRACPRRSTGRSSGDAALPIGGRTGPAVGRACAWLLPADGPGMARVRARHQSVKRPYGRLPGASSTRTHATTHRAALRCARGSSVRVTSCVGLRP